MTTDDEQPFEPIVEVVCRETGQVLPDPGPAHWAAAINQATNRDDYQPASINQVTNRDGYKTIVADPPWKEEGGAGRGTGAKYPTIRKRSDILATMLAAPCWRPASVCQLWLWATTTHLRDALWLMDALGFEYKTFALWLKLTKQGTLSMGQGQYMRHTFEPVLFGTKGAARSLSPAGHGLRDVVETVVGAQRRDHSRKPAEMFDRIELVSLGQPRLEMFARKPRPGWTVWGNEVEAA